MSDERLQQLLREADEAFGGPLTGPADLGARVRRRARRQRRVRVVGSAAVCVVVLIAGSIALVRGSGGASSIERPMPGAGVPPSVSIAEVQARIEQLSEEVRTGCEALQEALRNEEAEQRLTTLRKQAEANPLTEVDEQIDRAALTMVYQADRMYRELNLRDSAIASYERTVELFPRTHWAQVAKERLTEIKAAEKGDAS
jgi:hypothetical protein